jgi:acetyl esterase
MSALNWLLFGEGIIKFGGDKSKIILMGESAGGAISASVMAVHLSQTLRSESPVNGLILIYPTLEHGIYRDSHFKYSSINGLLSLEQMIWFWTLYLDESDRDCHDYRACPLRISDSLLSKFPETLLILAKYDILLDEGLEFNRRLDLNGVKSTAVVYNDTIHGFLGIPSESSKQAYSIIRKKVLELNL